MKKDINFILYLIGLAASYFLIARVYYVFGMMDERFDRYHANKKLQECLEVIKQ